MKLKHSFCYITALVSCALPVKVSAATDADLMRLLICVFPSPTSRLGDLKLDTLFAISTQDAESGIYSVNRPIRTATACITHVSFGAAFGQWAVIGEACDGKYEPLLDLARDGRPGLTIANGKPVSGVVSSYTDSGVVGGFSDPKAYGLEIYRGASSFVEKPDPTSKLVSYRCGIRVDSAQ